MVICCLGNKLYTAQVVSAAHNQNCTSGDCKSAIWTLSHNLLSTLYNLTLDLWSLSEALHNVHSKLMAASYALSTEYQVIPNSKNQIRISTRVFHEVGCWKRVSVVYIRTYSIRWALITSQSQLRNITATPLIQLQGQWIMFEVVSFSTPYQAFCTASSRNLGRNLVVWRTVTFVVNLLIPRPVWEWNCVLVWLTQSLFPGLFEKR